MKRIFLLLVIQFSIFSFSQEKADFTLEANYFSGNITLHNDGILHLITGHPEGVLLSFNKKTFGDKRWHKEYNYPDYGASFIFQDLKNEALGKNFGLYGHYNFYFFKRRLMFRVGQGLAFTTNPYDKVTNHKNNAFGTALLSSTYVMLNFKKERLFKNIGFQAGITLIHYSNANVKAPNTSINTFTFNAGLVYDFSEESREHQVSEEIEEITEPIRFNFQLSGGINESDIIGSRQFPFYVLTAYADKRISYKSAFQFGTEFFYSKFLEEYIKYEAAAFPDRNVDTSSDFKRIGVFVGHELFINKLSLVTQIGYYAYYPYDFEGRVYLRVGLKRYFGKKWFASASVKAHGTAAEAAEFGIGIRL